MSRKRYMIIVCQFVILLLSTCENKSGESEPARQALITFFSELSRGNYENASQLYGGSYEILTSFNPDIDADDHVALWENGCKINGLQCLTTRRIAFNELNDKGEYIFTVEFNTPDGTLFVLEACCGENQSTTSQFQFEYRVMEGKDGKFLVLDMPVYMP